MHIPPYLLPTTVSKVKPAQKKAVSMDKQENNPDTVKQEVIPVRNVQEKRRGEDRRKRNLKPLIDTRSGRDRRYDKDRPSIDIKA